jgi:hypothetical protein
MLPPALFAGVVTAETRHSFGPHEAVYSVTTDSTVAVDLGPLGAAVMPSPLPGPAGHLGMRVTVGPIPADLTTAGLPGAAGLIEGGSPSPALVQELAEYGQAYLGVENAVWHAVRALILDALVKAGIWWGSVMALTVLALLAAGRSRRNQVGFWARRHRALVAAAAVATMVAGAGVTWGVVAAGRPADPPAGDPLLAGTPFAQVRLTGRLGQLVSDYGGVALQAYRDTEAFYAKAAASVEDVFEEQAAAVAARAEPAADGELGEYGLPETTGASADASPGASPSPEPPWLVGAKPYGELRPALFFSDLHCNVGMAQVMGAAARASGAELVLDGGDTTMDGTSVERYCVDVVADALPEGVPWVVASGNHDTEATRRQEAAAGAVVLDGSEVDVAGLKILGDEDPTHTEVAQGTRLTGDETGADVAARLAASACAADPRPDLLLVHDPSIARQVLEGGCVPAAATGHLHSRLGPEVVGRGVLYTQSSTGRDTRETTTVGPLGSPAEMTVMLFDEAGDWVAWQLLTVDPDGGAKLAAIRLVPEPPPAEDAEDDGAGD